MLPITLATLVAPCNPPGEPRKYFLIEKHIPAAYPHDSIPKKPKALLIQLTFWKNILPIILATFGAPQYPPGGPRKYFLLEEQIPAAYSHDSKPKKPKTLLIFWINWLSITLLTLEPPLTSLAPPLSAKIILFFIEKDIFGPPGDPQRGPQGSPR